MNRKKQRMSPEVKNTERDLNERITALEKEVADKGTLINLNNVFEEEEKEEIRKLKPEFETLGAQLKFEREQLLMEKAQLEIEKAQLEMLLRKKSQLYIKTVDFENRFINAKEKFDNISNEVTKPNDAHPNINSLPDGILLKIFDNIKQNKFGQIARVCRRWNELTKSKILWKIVDVDLYESDTGAVKQFVQTLPSCVSCIKLDFTHDCWDDEHWDRGKLNFEKLYEDLREKCPHLQVLKFCNAKFLDSLPAIIHLCSQFLQNVTRLSFYNASFFGYGEEEYSSVSTIKALDVVKCFFEMFDFPQFSKMPCLRVLNLCRTHLSELWYEDDAVCFKHLKVLNLGFTGFENFRTFKIILNHAVNLEELYLCDVNLDEFNLSNLAFPYLKTICLRSQWDVTCDMLISLIQSCQSLENIYVGDLVVESYANHPFVVMNRSKLEIVKANNFCSCYKKINYLP